MDLHVKRTAVIICHQSTFILWHKRRAFCKWILLINRAERSIMCLPGCRHINTVTWSITRGLRKKNTRMIIIPFPSPAPLFWTRKLNTTYWRAQGRLLVTPDPSQGASVLLKACLLMSGGSRGPVAGLKML